MWNYNKKVMDHFLNPRNVGEVEQPDGTGEVGNISCGDALKLTFKLDADGRIGEVKFKTFGCASAIASSSALTELVKGMTLEEAAKVTNQDIVKLLGELPEEKMHCSVMGMEALQAAIADYRGEKVIADEAGDHEGAIVCKCFGVTDNKIRNVARQNNLHKAAEITHYCKAGGACGACLDDIQRILDELWKQAAQTPAAAPAADDFQSLSTVKKVFRVQEIIDKEIKPLLERDGGSIELVDLVGNKVVVRLVGRCASCPVSGVTLKHTVEDKLREFASPELTVESV
ncbi:Fe/S biogenesis protein NfuA [bioreactor metagenome]|uniref:Nitrogen fixation protein NifU n=1 Tax=bioreactor metagenome TaxID=1076179 RepID=A0A645AVT6_9ZZZZ